MNRLFYKLKMGVLISVRPLILRLNKSNYKNVVWLIGSGRSGTTWVSDLINYKKNYRELIEPFRPRLIKDANFLRLHQYLREEASWEKFSEFSKNVFAGNYFHKDIDSANNQLLYKDLLAKDVFANLFAYHVSKLYPDLKIVLLIRNPVDVALSKLAKKDWIWMEDPREFFEQKELTLDYLDPFRSLISEVGASDDQFLKHILVWCIINYVPLKQFKKEHLHVLFYESVLVDPNGEISKLNAFVKGGTQKDEVEIPQSIIEKPSSVSGNRKTKSASFAPDQKQLSQTAEIQRACGLDQLYSEQGEPNPDTLRLFGI